VSAWSPQGLGRTWPLWAIGLPLGASLIRAIGHIGTKYGLLEVDSPSFAVLVGNTVSLVTSLIPIVSATPLFTLLMTLLYFGRETITWRTIATIILIVPGVIVVALSGGR